MNLSSFFSKLHSFISPNSPALFTPNHSASFFVCHSLMLFIAPTDIPHHIGRIGRVFADFSIRSTIGLIISEMGDHLPEVTAILMNCRIKKVVRKKMSRLTKIVCHVSVMAVVLKGSFPNISFSWICIVLMPSIANVELLHKTDTVTPLKLFGNVPCMMLWILVTRIRIIEKPATKITGLKTRSIITENLRYFPIHQLFHPSHSSLKNT
ncbi:TPA: hypothetical protein DCZ39_08965 [Patescibacteria group bacterium]|nr:hypothetical protein [Candidatus Gracilibacteria bacterium]